MDRFFRLLQKICHFYPAIFLVATLLVGPSIANAAPVIALAKKAMPDASQIVAIGYYKKSPNWGAVGGFIGGVIVGGALSQGHEKVSPKQYRRRAEPEPKVAKITCSGGDIDEGECVCPKGTDRKKLGSRSYACEAKDLADDAYAPDEVVVALEASAGSAVETEIGKSLKLEVVDGYENELLNRRVVLFKIPDDRTPATVLAALGKDARVQGSQFNYYYRQQAGGEASTNEDRQYALTKINLQDAQAVARGRGVLIALIDGYVDNRNPALKSTLADLLDSTNQKDTDPDPHATAIAGIMNANGDIRGVAPEARILSIRAVHNVGGTADSYSLNKAIDLAAGQNARVVIVPLLGRHDPMTERVIQKAFARQITIVAPAGNNGRGAPPAYPAAYDEVIAVTATDAQDDVYSKANQGTYIGLAAPGVNIEVLGESKPEMKTGTSYAAAYVAGVAALLVGYDPQLTADTVKRTLMDTASDLGVSGKDATFGAGRVNAAGALHRLIELDPRRAATQNPTAVAQPAAALATPPAGQWQQAPAYYYNPSVPSQAYQSPAGAPISAGQQPIYAPVPSNYYSAGQPAPYDARLQNATPPQGQYYYYSPSQPPQPPTGPPAPSQGQTYYSAGPQSPPVQDGRAFYGVAPSALPSPPVHQGQAYYGAPLPSSNASAPPAPSNAGNGQPPEAPSPEPSSAKPPNDNQLPNSQAPVSVGIATAPGN